MKAISAGSYHACALASTGVVKCWGANWAGGLGNATTTDSSVPVGVVGLGEEAVAVSAGSGHSCALTSTGVVKCWGGNGAGQLGNATTTSSSVPVGVVGLGAGVVAVDVGGESSCAVTAGGALKCRGTNEDGQMGNATLIEYVNGSSVPVGVVGLDTGVVAVDVGASHTCAVVSAAGAVKCWGENRSGEVGDPTWPWILTQRPHFVIGLAGAVTVSSAGGSAANGGPSCAVTSAGGIKCWGPSGWGQLGAGTYSVGRHPVPVGVVGLGSGVVAVSVGGEHSCAVTSAGAVKCWGRGNYGALGDGTYKVSQTTALGKQSTWAYTPDGLLASTVDPRGHAAGADPAGYRTTYGYDPAGNLTTLTDPLAAVTTYGYDGANRPVTVTDPKGHKTTTAYNTLGLVTSVTNPDGGRVTNTYDAAGNVVGSKNPLGGDMTYVYDAVNRPVTATDPKSRTGEFSYDIAGRVISVKTPRGSTTYAYDTLGRRTGVNYSDATPDVTYGYDNASRQTSMIDGTGTTSYAYNTAGGLTGTTHGPTTFAYAYDPAGNLTTVAGPNGNTTTGYNADNLPVTMQRGIQDPTTYDYDPAGLLKTVTLPNDTTTSYTRDRAGQVTSQKHTLPTGILATRDYTYDTAGNPTSLATTRGTATTKRTWAYDDADRLTAECTGTTPCVPAAANLGWTYDKAGNILTSRDAAKTTGYTYDTAGQAINQTDGATTVPYTYDVDGNLTADANRTYAYDLPGRTTSVTTGAKTTAYTYDGAGNRASATTGTAVTGYTWDINSALPMLVRESTGATSQGYSYNPDSTPNALNATAADWYYLSDPQGSVTDVTTSTGARALSYDYTPYGQQRGPPVPDATTVPANQPMRYSGAFLDSTSGLYNLRARQYDPTTARFTSTDPIGGAGDTQTGNSLYAYANNSPLRYTDPSGRCPWCIGAIIGTVVGAVVGGAAYAISNQDDFSWGEFGKSTAIGAVSGAVAGGTFGLASGAVATALGGGALAEATGIMAGGAVANYYGATTASMLNGDGLLSPEESLAAAGTGALFAGAGYGAGKALGKICQTATPTIAKGGAAKAGGMAASEARQVTVRGRYKGGVDAYVGKPGFNALDLPFKGSGRWNWTRNKRFIDGAIDRGDEIRLVTDPTKPLYQGGNTFQRELKYLQDRGYTWQTQGDYWIAVPR